MRSRAKVGGWAPLTARYAGLLWCWPLPLLLLLLHGRLPLLLPPCFPALLLLLLVLLVRVSLRFWRHDQLPDQAVARPACCW
jgi:hypothetical protein